MCLVLSLLSVVFPFPFLVFAFLPLSSPFTWFVLSMFPVAAPFLWLVLATFPGAAPFTWLVLATLPVAVPFTWLVLAIFPLRFVRSSFGVCASARPPPHRRASTKNVVPLLSANPYCFIIPSIRVKVKQAPRPDYLLGTAALAKGRPSVKKVCAKSRK